jgi:hypothetical protein
MIRTVWLAAFCLAGLGGLCASKVTASISPAADVDPMMMTAAAAAPDTLDVTDRLDLSGSRPTAEVSLVQPAEAVSIRTTETSFPSHRMLRHRRAKPKGIASLQRPRARLRLSANNKLPRLSGDSKKCPGTSGLTALINLLTNSSHCS